MISIVATYESPNNYIFLVTQSLPTHWGRAVLPVELRDLYPQVQVPLPPVDEVFDCPQFLCQEIFWKVWTILWWKKVLHLLNLNHLMVELFKELVEMKSFHHFTVALCFGNFSDQSSELNGTTLT